MRAARSRWTVRAGPGLRRVPEDATGCSWLRGRGCESPRLVLATGRRPRIDASGGRRRAAAGRGLVTAAAFPRLSSVARPLLSLPPAHRLLLIQATPPPVSRRSSVFLLSVSLRLILSVLPTLPILPSPHTDDPFLLSRTRIRPVSLASSLPRHGHSRSNQWRQDLSYVLPSPLAPPRFSRIVFSNPSLPRAPESLHRVHRAPLPPLPVHG